VKLPLWRRITVWVLIVLATIIAIVSALTVWVKRQAGEEDAWVNTSAALLENDQVRGALSVFLVNQLYSNVDVQAALEQRLPANAKALAAPLAGALRQLAVRSADQLLQRPRVIALWKAANRTAHRRLIAVIRGKAKNLKAQDGNVVLDLRGVVEQLAQEYGVGQRALAQLPPDAGQIVIMQADQLDSIQKLARWIRALSIFIAIAVFVLYALAVYLARGRRRETLRAVGISLVIAGVVVLGVRRLVENRVIETLVKDPFNEPPVKQVWLIGSSLLSDVAWAGIGYGLVLIAAAWLAGPTRIATWIRRRLAPTFRDQPFLPFLVVGVLYVLVLLWGPTRAQREWIPILVFAVLLAFATEAFRRLTVREFPDGSARPAGSPP
jgi:hypothetical protein